MDGIVCVKHDPGQPNTAQKFADDFVKNFHNAENPQAAIDTAKLFLNEVRTRPVNEQESLLRRASEVDTATGCGTKFPELEIEFWKGDKNYLGTVDVLTVDESKSWNNGLFGYTQKNRTQIFNKLVEDAKPNPNKKWRESD